ncbi:Leishmanolysin-like peptidase [Armadillidium vulgare]|nr:Leishmanolysin-like peptidase [Armadillidium vulgare]
MVPKEHLNGCRVCDSVGNDCHLQTPAKGKGILDTDFIFYISALETDRCKKGFTVAYAAHCQQESTLDRPIAGHVNLCPFSISIKKQEVQTLLSTVKHEILHALGFSVSLYAYFRDDNGEPLTERTESGKPPLNEQLQARQWGDKTIKKIVRNDWLVREGEIKKQIYMMVTPNVAREAKMHFACPTLEGGELEDQGFDGTALTHWEKRAFENEAMTGTHTQNPVYSRITLALMEDTGWYYANYDMAQPLKWGEGLGCTFAKGSCMKWITEQISKGRSIHPYCNKVKNDPLETECTDDRNSEFTWKSQNVVVRGSHCHFKENKPAYFMASIINMHEELSCLDDSNNDNINQIELPPELPDNVSNNELNPQNIKKDINSRKILPDPNLLASLRNLD